MRKCIAGIMTMLLFLTGCGSAAGSEETGKMEAYKSITETKEPETIDYEDWEAKWELREDNPVSEETIKAISNFSYRSAAWLLREEGNFKNRNYSPLSLYYALALTAQGASGETEEEFLALLGMEDKETVAAECGRLFRRLYTDNGMAKLKLADSLWMKQGQEFEDDFIRTAEENFYASLFEADFTNPETGKAMGQWIADQTEGLLAPEIPADLDTVLSIINTVYLYDEWVDNFSEEFNTEDGFTKTSGEEITCEYMNRQTDSRPYYQGEGYTGTSLNLKNTGSMLLILPDEGVELRDLLTEEKLEEMFSGQEAAFGTVNLSLPKFRFGDGGDMMPMLKELGLARAFDSQEADFSKMAREPVYISLVNQETYIGINENGVEAAAYTIVEMAAGADPGEPEIYELNFNRPFLFGIISNEGVPLFLGICEDPLQ